MQDNICSGQGFNLLHIFCRNCFRDSHSHSCPADIDGKKSDEQGNGGNYFKIQQGFPAHPANLLQIGMSCNTHHNSGKKQGCNDCFYQPEKYLADDLQMNCYLGQIISKNRTGHHADQYPDGQ